MSDQSRAYRGYYITHNTTYDEFYISKDGHNVGSAKSLREAMTTIDFLLDDGA